MHELNERLSSKKKISKARSGIWGPKRQQARVKLINEAAWPWIKDKTVDDDCNKPIGW